MVDAHIQGQLMLAATRVDGKLSLAGTFDGGGAEAIYAHGAVLQGEVSYPKASTPKAP